MSQALLTVILYPLLVVTTHSPAQASARDRGPIEYIEILRTSGYREPVSYVPRLPGPKAYELWLGDPLEEIEILVEPRHGVQPSLRVEQQVIRRGGDGRDQPSRYQEIESEIEDCYRFALAPIPPSSPTEDGGGPEAVRIRVSVLEGDRWRAVEALTIMIPAGC